MATLKAALMNARLANNCITTLAVVAARTATQEGLKKMAAVSGHDAKDV
jgi:hypothetical protein